MKVNRSKDWLEQAERDLEWGKDSFKCCHFSATCFISQQIGEKAIKAYAYLKGYEPRGHSIVALANDLKINGDILEAGKRLDQYYISARYPDALPAGIPSDYFTKDQAEEALKFAQTIIKTVKKEFKN